MIRFYRPELRDMWFRQKMLSDPATMQYNHAWGGTVPFPEEEWEEWYSHWLGDDGKNRYYRYLADGNNDFIGEAAYHFDQSRGICVADIIVFAPYRHKGYGGQALELLCGKAAENGISVMYDDIAIDNPAISLFLKHGFHEEYRTNMIIMLKRTLTPVK